MNLQVGLDQVGLGRSLLPFGGLGWVMGLDLACRILCMSASSAESERSFSSYDYRH